MFENVLVYCSSILWHVVLNCSKRVVVKIMVPFWVPIIIRTNYLGYPKRDINFDNYPYYNEP